MSNQYGYGSPNGPDFQPPPGWQQPTAGPSPFGAGQEYRTGQGYGAPGQPPRPPAPRPRRRWPTWLTTVAIIAAVALVLGATALWAARDQAAERARAEASASASPPPPRYSARADEIAFSSSEGQGILRINSHSREGDRLLVNLSVVATSGNLSFSFAGFDEAGRYIEASYETPDPSVASGYVDEGLTVTGNVGFDIPPGVFTLTMTNDAGESVTALQIR